MPHTVVVQRAALATILIGAVLATGGVGVHVWAADLIWIFGRRPSHAVEWLLQVSPWVGAAAGAGLIWCAVTRSPRLPFAFAAWLGALALMITSVALAPGTTPDAGARLALAATVVALVAGAVWVRRVTQSNDALKPSSAKVEASG